MGYGDGGYGQGYGGQGGSQGYGGQGYGGGQGSQSGYGQPQAPSGSSGGFNPFAQMLNHAMWFHAATQGPPPMQGSYQPQAPAYTQPGYGSAIGGGGGGSIGHGPMYQPGQNPYLPQPQPQPWMPGSGQVPSAPPQPGIGYPTPVPPAQQPPPQWYGIGTSGRGGGRRGGG